MEKSSKQQAERIEKKREEKAQAKKEAKKADAKKAKEKKAEEKAEKKEKEEKVKEDRLSQDDEDVEVKGQGRGRRSYTELTSSSLEDLVNAVRNVAYVQSEVSVQTAAEKVVGGSIDFKG